IDSHLSFTSHQPGPPEISPLSLHDALPILEMQGRIDEGVQWLESRVDDWAPNNSFAFHNWWHLALFYLDRGMLDKVEQSQMPPRSEEHTSELQSLTNLVCRLLLEKKKSQHT